MAITFVNSHYDRYFNPSSSDTLSTVFDIGTRTNGLLVVSVHVRSTAGTVSGITWNGTALTQAAEIVNNASAPGWVTSLWYLAGPANGSNTLQVTLDGSSTSFAVIASWYDGAAQTSTLDNQNTATGNSGTQSVALTPTQDNCLIVGAVSSETNSVLTVGSGETAIDNRDEGAWVIGGSYVVQTTAGAQTVDWSGGSDQWSAAAASFAEASGGASPVTVSASPGVVSVSGPAATVSAATTISAAAGVVSVSGITASIQVGSNVTVQASPGVVSVSGQAATIVAPIVVAAAAGVVSVTGQAATVSAATTISASTATVSVAGQAATVVATTTVSAGAGVVSVTGQQATIVSGAVTVQASAGVITVSGIRATIDTARFLYDVDVSDALAYSVDLVDEAIYSVALAEENLYSVELSDASRA